MPRQEEAWRGDTKVEVDVRRDNDKRRQSPHYHSRSHFSFSLSFTYTPTAHSPCPKGGGAAAANNFISCPQAAVRHLGAHFILGPCLDLHLNLQQQQQKKSNDNSREKDAMLGSAWLEATLSTWMQNNLPLHSKYLYNTLCSFYDNFSVFRVAYFAGKDLS